MTDESNGHTRPDFEDHLREVVRRRQSRQKLDDELGEDRLELSGKAGERDVFTPRGARSGEGGNDQLMWVALGLGGTALVITLILGALIYRQGAHINQLEETIGLLEEQMEVNNPQQIGSGLQADIAQLNARMNAIDHRLAQLEQGPAASETGATAELKAQLDRLNETVGQLQAKLASVKAQAAPPARAQKAKPADTKPTGKGWYIVLASLADAGAAKKLQQRYRQQGIAAEIQEVKVKGARRYRLRVGPFATARQATRQAAQVKQKLKLASVWLSR